MGKRSFKGGAMLNPVPAVMVSCGSRKPNIITIAWTGIVNSNPPMTYISVRKERYSHNIIESTGEFVINLCSEELAFATDFCGVRSGRDTDKFKEMKLTPERAEIVRCPMIKESPVNIECRVREIIELGSHDMFIADILKVPCGRAVYRPVRTHQTGSGIACGIQPRRVFRTQTSADRKIRFFCYEAKDQKTN